MPRINKFLLIAFTLLLIFTVGEIVYYFFFLSPQRTQTGNQAELSTPSTVAQTQQIDSTVQAIDSSIIDNLRLYKKGFLESSILENTIKGKIVNIRNQEGSVNFPINQESAQTVNYKVQLTIENANSTQSNFYFRESDLAKTTIVSGEDEETKLSFDDLQIDDQITVIERLNLLEKWENSFMSYKIIKE